MKKTHLDKALPKVKRHLQAAIKAASEMLVEAAVKDAVDAGRFGYEREVETRTPEPPGPLPEAVIAEAVPTAEQVEDELADDAWKGEDVIRNVERDCYQERGANWRRNQH